jgi:UPF0755 protein
MPSLVRKLLGLVVFALLAGLVAVWMLWWSAGPADKPQRVVVQQGATLGVVAGQLHKAGVIPGSRRTYLAMARLFGSGDPVQAGEFEVPRGMSGAAVLDLIQHGGPVQRLMTIPEGMPSIMVQERLAALPFASGEATLPAEGSVLPDSYSYARGEARSAILKRATEAMTRTLDELWEKRSPNTVVTSKAEAVTLASIVEKETGKPAERPTVAGVYSNRLRMGMKLDADPTVIYPITRGKPLGRRILRSELDADNGYNTYRRAGLPDGPIANPGKASIAAVLNPAPTRALYFVADGTGGHVFAETLAEQNANVAKWFALRRQRGEIK